MRVFLYTYIIAIGKFKYLLLGIVHNKSIVLHVLSCIRAIFQNLNQTKKSKSTAYYYLLKQIDILTIVY